MPEISPSKYLVQAGWQDVPHLDEKTKAELLAGTPPHLRAARSKGTPSMGSGAIYPIPLEEIQVTPFAIPAFWPRAYALDVGWNRTAAIWGAIDPTDGTAYQYSEHYMAEAVPSAHVDAIRARGSWIPGVIDPAARGRSQHDGTRLIDEYEAAGLDLTFAKNDVEAGLHLVWQMLASGRLKVFSTLGHFASEYQLYRRDEKGRIVKKSDHLMDCLRYWCLSGRDIAVVKPVDRAHTGARGLPAADSLAGY